MLRSSSPICRTFRSRSPGVELRPMTQITGHAEFCELFLDDVSVPVDRRLGQELGRDAMALYVGSARRVGGRAILSGEAVEIFRGETV